MPPTANKLCVMPMLFQDSWFLLLLAMFLRVEKGRPLSDSPSAQTHTYSVSTHYFIFTKKRETKTKNRVAYPVIVCGCLIALVLKVVLFFFSVSLVRAYFLSVCVCVRVHVRVYVLQYYKSGCFGHYFREGHCPFNYGATPSALWVSFYFIWLFWPCFTLF